MEAMIIKANGRQKSVTPINGTDFSLKELQRAVAGCIEILSLGDGLIMVMDDNGMGTKPDNIAATILASKSLGYFCPIYGDVVVCADEMVK